MEIVEVKSARQAKDFLRLPVQLHAGDPLWIRPLDKEITAVFDPKKNPFFSHGECTRWVLYDDNRKAIGRIAAFVDRKTCDKNDQPTGGMGFFECIHDQAAANLLFDTCKQWLSTKKMQAMDGPINFGTRDKWWGVLIDGFEHPPNYGMNYNPPYYKVLLETYGFREYYQQYTYYRKVAGGIDHSIQERADRLNRNGQYRFSNIVDLDLDQVKDDFREVFNKAWASFPDVVQMSRKDVAALLKQIKPIMDRRLIWFGYYGETPIAFAIMLPEVNQIFKDLNGQFGIWQQLRFLWKLRQGVCTKMVGVAFGIVPRFQRKGVESAMIEAISKMAYYEDMKFNYVEIEHNWVGDFNPNMMHVHELMGGSIRKVHATYRFLFDRAQEFKRAPIVNSH